MSGGGKNERDARIQRIEKAIQLLSSDRNPFGDERKALLRSEGLLTDAMQKLAVTMRQLAEAQRRTTPPPQNPPVA